MSRLTRDGTVEPVSRDQILRHKNADREIFIFPVQLTTCETGKLTRLIHALAICMRDHKYNIQGKREISKDFGFHRDHSSK